MSMRSGILDWEIPWTEEPGGLQSMPLQRIRVSIHTHSISGNFFIILNGKVNFCKPYELKQFGWFNIA